MDDNFVCLICTDLPQDAVETLCCGQLMCEKCSEDLKVKHQICPNCREPLTLKPSMISRRIISNIKVECQFGCGQSITQKQKKLHERLCRKKKIKCSLCSGIGEISGVVDHMREQHHEKLIELVINFHEPPKEESSQIKQSSSCQASEGMMKNKIKNGKGNLSEFGTTGKYYCGQKALIGKCGCCDGRCGPTNGENCDECMELDVKRFMLTKGFLVNPDGYVCKADPTRETYYCGRRYKGGFCSPMQCCQSCNRIIRSIKLGRYKSLI